VPTEPARFVEGSRGELPIEALGNLSHDLNNALSVILTSSTSLLRREPADEATRRQLELLQRSARRIGDLTEELNDAVAIGSGELDLKLASLETGQVLQEALETAQRLAPQRCLRLSGGDGPLWIRGDHLRLQRVIAHLLRSALSASLDGTVDATIERRATEACIKIADGVGAKASGSSASSEGSVFQPLKTQHRSLARYVSHGVAVAHGGRLWLEPQPEGGTLFLVCLPISASRA
jgi:signal transduction histidine kinase